MQFSQIQIVAGLLLFILLSCSQPEENIPDSLIPRDTFIEMMTDMQLFEAINKVQHDRNKEDFNLDEAYQWLFDKYDLDQSTFRTSFEYYANDPKRMEEIYDEVIIRISQREAEEAK